MDDLHSTTAIYDHLWKHYTANFFFFRMPPLFSANQQFRRTCGVSHNHVIRMRCLSWQFRRQRTASHWNNPEILIFPSLKKLLIFFLTMSREHRQYSFLKRYPAYESTRVQLSEMVIKFEAKCQFLGSWGFDWLAVSSMRSKESPLCIFKKSLVRIFFTQYR